MSKSSNYSGRTIVVDKVVQLAEEENSGLDYFAQQLEIEAQKLTAKQSEYNNKYSIAVSGRFVATDRTPAEITLNIYRNDTKLTSSDAVVFGSSIAYVSENGTYAEYGEYASLYTRTIPITKLKNLTESVRCVWRGNDSNAIPLVTTFKIDVGEAVEYAYSKYTDEDKVKSQGELQWWYSVEDAKKVTSDELRYLWQRRSSNYDFDTQQYTDWKYYKTDIDYPSKSTDDTAKDTIEIITPAKYVTFLSSKNTFTVNRRATDGETDILTFSYVCSGYKTHEIDSANPWIATAYKSNGEVSQLATGTATTFTITVPHNGGYSSIVVTATVLTNKGTGLEESHAYTLTLTPIDVTLPEKYLGVLTTLPTGGVLPDGSRAENGDWFVYKNTNVMYVYDSATLTWTAYDSSDSLDTIPLEKVSVALGDMINLGTNDHTTATLMGVFKALCADRGFIKFLQTYSLLVSKNNFKVEISATDPTTGEDLANPLFKVSYKDTTDTYQTVFQIDSATGNVFFGEPNSALTAPEIGFMFRRATKSIIGKLDGSSNPYFELDENGRLTARDAYFSGRFDCDVIKTRTQSETNYNFSLSTISNRQAYNLSTNFSDNSLGYSLYECTLAGFSSVKYVRYQNYSSDSYSWTEGSIWVRYYLLSYTCQGMFQFYDSQMNAVDISDYVSGQRKAKCVESGHSTYEFTDKAFPTNAIGSFNITKSGEGTGYSENLGLYFTSARTLTITTGGQILLVDLPTSTNALPSGALYKDGAYIKVVL